MYPVDSYSSENVDYMPDFFYFVLFSLFSRPRAGLAAVEKK